MHQTYKVEEWPNQSIHYIVYVNSRRRFRVVGARKLPNLLKVILFEDLSAFTSNDNDSNVITTRLNNQLLRLRMLVDFIKLVVYNFNTIIKELSTPAEV